MTYEENVQRIAEEMAEEHVKGLPESAISSRKYWVRYFTPFARIALKHMAESVRNALENAIDNGMFYTEGMADPPMTDYDQIDQYLIKNGLIPAQEGGQNEKA
jgi:hypothetical protein